MPAGYADHGRPLTPRMTAILAQAAEGMTVAQSAAALGITPATVRTIRAAACARLHARNVTEAVATGYRTGILS